MYSEVDYAIDLIGDIEVPNGEEDLFVLRRMGQVGSQGYPFNLSYGDSGIEGLNWKQARFLAQEASELAKNEYGVEYGLITPTKISEQYKKDRNFRMLMLFNNIYNGCCRVHDEENSKIYDFFNPEIRIVDDEFKIDPLEKLLEKQDLALVKDLDREPNREVGAGHCKRDPEEGELEFYFLNPESSLRNTIAVLERME